MSRGDLFTATPLSEVVATLALMTSAGFSNEDFLKLRQEGGLELLKDFRSVLLNKAKIERIKLAVDCGADSDPSWTCDGLWEIEYHDRGLGLCEIDPCQIQLCRADQQLQCKHYTTGNVVLEELRKWKGRKFLNINVLDACLAAPQLIPDAWEGKRIFFWGTIYHEVATDVRFVYYLERSRMSTGAWECMHTNVNSLFGASDCAASIVV